MWEKLMKKKLSIIMFAITLILTSVIYSNPVESQAKTNEKIWVDGKPKVISGEFIHDKVVFYIISKPTSKKNGIVAAAGYTGTAKTLIIPNKVTYKKKTYDIKAITTTKDLYHDEDKSLTNSWGEKVNYIKLPESVITITEGAFYGCKNLMKIDLPLSLKTIESGSFYNTSIKELIIPKNVWVIRTEAFKNCNKLKTIIFKGKTQYIEDEAFANCTSLNKLSLSEGLEDIGWDAFTNCKKLKKLTIPDSVYCIRGSSFMGCINLSLQEKNNLSFKIINDCLYSEDGKTFVTAPAVSGDVEMLNTTEDIWIGAFEGNTKITGVTFSSKINTLPNWLFSGCTSLKKVNIPSKIIKLEAYTFNGCSNLQLNVERTLEERTLSVNSFLGTPYEKIITKAVTDENAYNLLDYELQGWVDVLKEFYSQIDATDTESEKVKKAYMWLIKEVSYDYPASEAHKDEEAYGVPIDSEFFPSFAVTGFFQDRQIVCSGYADMMCLLLELCHVECTRVISPKDKLNHAWNAVKVDGVWYQLDATWDDDGNTMRNKYFLISDEEMEKTHGTDYSVDYEWRFNYIRFWVENRINKF
jgi:hypothetical protein